MKIAVVYTRYSTLKQGLQSETRQNELARNYVERIGATLFGTYSDRGQTGTTIQGRPALDQLLVDARAGKFNVVIVELLDRIGRVMSGLYKIYRQLLELGIEIHEVNGTRIDRMSLLLKGLQAVEGRTTFLDRTKNGRKELILRGLNPHRIRYGYVAGQKKGMRTIHPDRARVVKNIFERTVAGHGPAEIAVSLTNIEPTPADCVAIDAGRQSPNLRSPWSAAMVIAILRCPLYKGLIVDGTTRPDRDPNTRKVRRYYSRPESEHVFGDAPKDLIIVDPRIWKQAFDIVEDRYANGLIAERCTKYLLTGRLKCGRCLAPMASFAQHGVRRYVCEAAKHGVCVGSGRPAVADVEIAVVAAITQLADNEAFWAGYAAEFKMAREAGRAEIERRRSILEQELARIDREVAILPDTAHHLGFSEVIINLRLEEVQGQRAALSRELQALPEFSTETEDVAKAGSMQTALETLIARAPLRGEDPRTRRLMAEIRELVTAVYLEREPGNPCEYLHVDFNVLAFFGVAVDGPVKRITTPFPFVLPATNREEMGHDVS